MSRRKTSFMIRGGFYVIGFLIMTLGIAISVKSDLGVSPVSSIPYTITCVWGMEMGRATILFHIVLVMVQLLILRKNFQMKNLLQVPVGILFGMFTTLSNYLMTFFPEPKMLLFKFSMLMISTFFIAIGIFLYVPTDIVPLAGEGTMLAISFMTKKKFSSIKLMFDISMVALSVFVCLMFLHTLGSVGLGTVLASVFVGTELKVITWALGRKRDQILQTFATTMEHGNKAPLPPHIKSDIYIIKE